MSRYTYAGDFKNPTEGWYVKEFGNVCDDSGGSDTYVYEIWVREERAKDGSAPPDHKHTSAPTFNTPEEAEEWIEGTREFFEQDYDEYLEENSYELARMERYEMWRNEY